MTVLVTGATGNVGFHVIRLLHAQGIACRAAVSGPSSAARLPNPEIDWRVLDYTRPETYPSAFEGIKRLFLIRPPAISNIDRDMQPLLDFAAGQGVEHITFLSLLGAEKNRVVPHAKIEAALRAGPTAHTFLRAGFFMQNLSTTHRHEIREHDKIWVPAGNGKTAFIDARDIAEVAVKSLTEAGHAGQAYDLTGAEALTYDEVAAIFSRILQRSIRYTRPNLLRFALHMRQQGNPWPYTAVVSAIYVTTRFGLAARVSPTLEQLLSRPPRTLTQFVSDHADLWRANNT